MKKRLTYLLLLLVALIWGLIIYRLVKGRTGDADQVMTPAPVQKTAPAKSAVPQELLGGYRDPFLGGGAPDTSDEQQIEMIEEMAALADMTDWSQIQYLGIIRNQQTQADLFLLNISGQDYMLKAGETQAGVTLLAGDETAAIVNYQGNKNTIHKQ